MLKGWALPFVTNYVPKPWAALLEPFAFACITRASGWLRHSSSSKQQQFHTADFALPSFCSCCLGMSLTCHAWAMQEDWDEVHGQVSNALHSSAKFWSTVSFGCPAIKTVCFGLVSPSCESRQGTVYLKGANDRGVFDVST
jgi:hypothetical protein